MMRVCLASLASIAVCLLYAQGSVAAPHAGTSKRSWQLSLSPAPDDLALAQIDFPRAGAKARLSGRAARLTVAGPFGDDYLALVAVSGRLARRPRALVLVVNRPSALLDPAGVALLLRAPVSLGAPVVDAVEDPLAQPPSRPPALCDLSLHGSSLSPTLLRGLSSRGTTLPGFNPSSAAAQAYDLVCGLPHESSFTRAVSGQQPQPAPTPTPIPTPTPPGCTPCDPRPGYACPLASVEDICVASMKSPSRP
jgi:hypothetical protein